MAPYREPAPQIEPHADVRGDHGDPSFALAMGIFGALSLIRVLGALLEHETFGAEASLALLSVLLGVGSAGRYAARAARRWTTARRDRTTSRLFD